MAMAWRMKVKFKVTQRGTDSTTARTNIPRGRHDVKYVEKASVSEREPADYTEPTLSPSTSVPDLCGSGEEQIPSLHAIKQAANAEAWKAIRSDLLKAATESFAMPLEQCCLLCSDAAQYRCIQCGPNCYYCSQCLGYSHCKTNLFHIPEEWVVSDDTVRIMSCSLSYIFRSIRYICFVGRNVQTDYDWRSTYRRSSTT